MTGILKRNRIMLRSASVTFIILFCALSAVLFMGKAYAVTEKNAFCNETEAVIADGNDRYTVFGKEIYFPIVSVYKKVDGFYSRYAPGILKLLGFAKNGAEELFDLISDYMVSSRK